MALTSAMSSGIAGLKAHMSALNVTGNNVANVNTYGYKAGRVTFKETVYSTQQAGSDGGALTGGTNPMQTGYGVSIGTIDLNMATQSLESTGFATDVAIQGDGFFLIGTKDGVAVDSLASLDFSRVGNFRFDANGYLVDGSGGVVYGFVSVNDPEQDGAVATGTAAGGSGTATSTQLVPIRMPLEVTQDFIDANPGIDDRFVVTQDFLDANVGATTALPALGSVLDSAAITTLDADFTAAGETLAGVEMLRDESLEVGDAFFQGVGADGLNAYDATFAGVENLGPIEMESISIDQSGVIKGINKQTGEPVVVGTIALGNVPNPAGLTHTDGPYYQALGSTGEISITTPGGSLSGYLNNQTNGSPETLLAQTTVNLMPNFLEQSGTDLATEFANMITYQRGYQANTRVVTVTDTMLEELINMKR